MIFIFEYLFFKYFIKPKVKKWNFVPSKLSKERLTELRKTLYSKPINHHLNILGKTINPFQKFTISEISEMLKFWTRQTNIPPKNSYIDITWKRISELENIGYFSVFPSLIWYCIQSCLKFLFHVYMKSFGFKKYIINGIEIWDNHGDSSHPIIYFHGVSPEGLFGHFPWFFKWRKRKDIRLIIPIQPVLCGQTIIPVFGTLEIYMNSTETYLRKNKINSIHLIGHSAGVASINTFYNRQNIKTRSRICVDPVHHINTSRHAQNKLQKTFFQVLFEIIFKFWDLRLYVELILLFVLNSPSLLIYGCEISSDIACYNFIDTDNRNLMYILGKYDTLIGTSIEKFKNDCKKSSVLVTNTLHGQTLFHITIDNLIDFQKNFNRY